MGICSNSATLDEIIEAIKIEESKRTLHNNYISGEDFDRLVSGDKYKSCFDKE